MRTSVDAAATPAGVGSVGTLGSGGVAGLHLRLPSGIPAGCPPGRFQKHKGPVPSSYQSADGIGALHSAQEEPGVVECDATVFAASLCNWPEAGILLEEAEEEEQGGVPFHGNPPVH